MPTSTSAFIAAVAPLAQAAERVSGVPASISMAQSILESGWGTSTLARLGNAYFGIKCSRTVSVYQSGCMSKESLEYYPSTGWTSQVSTFRIYPSIENSFKDHGALLKYSSRYAAAFTTSHPDDFARALQAGGYATDPAYADKLISLMVKYRLYRFDLA